MWLVELMTWQQWVIEWVVVLLVLLVFQLLPNPDWWLWDLRHCCTCGCEGMLVSLCGHAKHWRLAKGTGATHSNPECRRSRSRKWWMDGVSQSSSGSSSAPWWQQYQLQLRRTLSHGAKCLRVWWSDLLCGNEWIWLLWLQTLSK